MRYRYAKIDAFTYDRSRGNPAACLYLERDEFLDAATMLEIAREHKGFVSEVVYCTPHSDGSYTLRYYSSECEVEFCGHGTIACMYDVFGSSPEMAERHEAVIRTRKGSLNVYNDRAARDAVYITAPDPEYGMSEWDIDTVASAFDVSPGMMDDGYPIRVINAGLNTLIVPMVSRHAVLGLEPDEQRLKTFCFERGVDIVLVFTTDVSARENKIRTRVFAPKFGYLEDPATGSGNSAMGYYMKNHDMWDGQPISIEQNGEEKVYNLVKLKMMEERVLFGGGATVRIRGEYISD